MRKPIELNYIKRNGMLYPYLQISNNKADDKQPIGKYGMMWLRFMFEWHYDRYIELRISVELLRLVHKINDETFEMIKSQIGYVNSTERLMLEDAYIKEFVLTVR